ncbi:MAG: LPS export ABC transporter periplasmic protein LptC [Prevotella sp.]|nr:LPS export ABC transporter periplasmic protein LptC [Prevotella sp.]
MESRLIRFWLLAFGIWLLVVACEQPKEHTAPAIHERDSVSMMTTYGVNTLISDSGVIKYRIVTERWDVNTIKNPSRWTFERGVFLEQYDNQFHVEGYVFADTAWYYDQLKLWELRGRVRIRNLNGLVFRSEELFWDGMNHEYYSHKYSRLVTPERELEGTYFRSDEHMRHYVVTNSTGSFQSSDLEPEEEEPAKENDKNKNAADTAKQKPPVRQAAVKHKATTKPIQP